MTDDPANRAEQVPRNPDGTFPPGVSGNPAGRPKRHAEFRELIREMTPEAVRQLTDKVAKGDLDAIRFVIEQGWGKAVTAPAEEGSGENSQTIEVRIRQFSAPRGAQRRISDDL